ncbi:MAG: NfeD family protein [Rickettsiales bacterium]
MDFDINYIMVLWFAIGVFLVAAELTFTGINFIFPGLAAITVGLLLNFSLIPNEDYTLQLVVFSVATIGWVFALWKPIKNLDLRGKNKTYDNIVGKTALVAKNGLNKEKGGEIVWSGAIIEAELVRSSDGDNLKEGDSVIIKEIQGNKFIVTSK